MKPTTLSIFELFEKERRYLVPLFQRPYVWKEDPQWEQLWQNVADQADSHLFNQADPSSIRSHFLGAVVLNQVKTYGRQVSAMEVIDGQQRLTTLQVLLVALRDFLKANGEDPLIRTLERLTSNSCRMEDEIEEHKVWPTSSDRAVFADVVRLENPVALEKAHPITRKKWARKPDPRPRLIEAYLYFWKKIEEYVSEERDQDLPEFLSNGDPQLRAEAILEAISRHLEVVVIELEDRDDPQVIFETLNAYGEPLLPSDLIRNFVFLEADRKREDIQYLYDKLWRPYDDEGVEGASFWMEETRQGRLNRPRLDLFAFHYLTLKRRKEFAITHLFQEFREWWRSSDRNVEEELTELQTYSTHFRALTDSESDGPVAKFAERLGAIDTSTVFPVVLVLLESNRLGATSDQGLAENLQALESYLVRRLVCSLTTKNYNRVFLSLLREVSEQEGSLSVVDHLLSLTGDSVRWPDDEEFSAAWKLQPVYRNLSQRRVRMILQAIEEDLWTERQEHLELKGGLSIEHVMPQTPTEEHWPLRDCFPEASEETSDAELENHRREAIQTLGNLTLLTQPLNSSVKNGPFRVKRAEIARQSKLQLNAYFQQFDNSYNWNAQSIVDRGQLLLESARKIWPHSGPVDA